MRHLHRKSLGLGAGSSLPVSPGKTYGQLDADSKDYLRGMLDAYDMKSAANV